MAYVTPPSSDDEDELYAPRNRIVKTAAVESDTEMFRGVSPGINTDRSWQP